MVRQTTWPAAESAHTEAERRAGGVDVRCGWTSRASCGQTAREAKKKQKVPDHASGIVWQPQNWINRPNPQGGKKLATAREHGGCRYTRKKFEWPLRGARGRCGPRCDTTGDAREKTRNRRAQDRARKIHPLRDEWMNMVQRLRKLVEEQTAATDKNEQRSKPQHAANAPSFGHEHSARWIIYHLKQKKMKKVVSSLPPALKQTPQNLNYFKTYASELPFCILFQFHHSLCVEICIHPSHTACKNCLCSSFLKQLYAVTP